MIEKIAMILAHLAGGEFIPAVPKPPTVVRYRTSYGVLKSAFDDIGVGVLNPGQPLDAVYYYTNAEGWADIINHVNRWSNLYMPSSAYETEVSDCEDFGIWAALMAQTILGREYKINGMRMVVGDIPTKHGFNIMPVGDDHGALTHFLLYEPNQGFPFMAEPFEVGDHNYQPKLVLL